MRVLLVEDDDGVGNALTEALAVRGHLPTRVTRGADALIQHHKADLVLLDLGLPDMDGMDVLRMLHAITKAPIMILTAKGDERSVVRGCGSAPTTTWSSPYGSRSCSPGWTPSRDGPRRPPRPRVRTSYG
ncbi:hypothetical protein GCM10029964_044900 [Kibdelosporangium lantanae]